PGKATCSLSSTRATRPTTWCVTSSSNSGWAWSAWNHGGTGSPKSSAEVSAMSSGHDGAPTGVIHNIGYSGYDGPRLGRPAVAVGLFLHSLRSAYGVGRGKSKILPLGLFGLMCLPALILAVITVVVANQGVLSEPLLPYARYAMVTQAALAIFVAVQAPQSVSLDLRFQTLPLYFSRPMARADYALAKYAALSVAVFILLAVPLL